MKKLFSLLTFALLQALCGTVSAADMPQISQAGAEKWYYIQFTSGGNVVADQGEGAEALTATMSLTDAQMWKVEGSASDGYTFTNKLGRMLYVTATTQSSGFFRTAEAPASNQLFVLIETAGGGGFLIAPKANQTTYMNQWQGAGAGKRLGLWSDAADSGSEVTFTEAETDVNAILPLIPYPTKLSKGEGKLDVRSLTAITCPEEGMQQFLDEFAAQLSRTAGITLAVNPEAAADGTCIRMEKDEALAAEAYTLTIDAGGISIQAAGKAGFFYALQTLKQLLPWQLHADALHTEANWALPYLYIEDAPRFGYRGYMLDVARHFFTKEEVKHVLDILAFYKMNQFHWHLTDDQGWRIEIPEYPKLTEVGAIRSGSFTNAGGSQNFYDDTEYGRGCYFTLDDLREVVAYAAERNITILPEIDLPGHMVAALASYPEFSCDPSKTYSVRIDGGISQDVLDISNPEVITFLKTVLGHIAEVFPGPYIHIGGDECPTANWEASESCLALAKSLGLTTSAGAPDVSQLQGWLVEQLGEFLEDNYGKGIVVWDELLSRWPTTNRIKPVVMAWNNISKSAEAANKGFKSVIVPYQNLYFDFMQVSTADADVCEVYQGGWGPNWVTTVATVYNLNPVSSLSGREEYALGPQGNMWTETCSSIQQVEYQLLPRLLALSEIGWLPNGKKNWMSFLQRLQSHDEIFEAEGWTFAKHYFDEPERTAAESALLEADDILANTVAGAAGYATQEACDALQAAADALRADMESDEKASALTEAIATFKQSPIVQPDPAKTYQLVSASSYYLANYAGSTAYVSGENVRFHYTPQFEPEELWQFEAQTTEGSFVLRNLLTGAALYMPTYNANVQASATQSTPIRVDKATVANGNYTYIPGVVNISITAGYSAATNAAIRRMYADVTGYVKAYNDQKLCCQGTWRLREVSDYAALLQRLVDKCELIILKNDDGQQGTPSPTALEYLQTNLIDAARAETEVDAEVYQRYMQVYKDYLAMPRISFLDQLSEEVYYRIHNAYESYSSYYAKSSASGQVQFTTTDTSADECLWHVRKVGDGTAHLVNKADGKTARVASATESLPVFTAATATAWTLTEYSSAESSGVLIQTGAYSWYINPNAWQYVLLKPIEWGASVWVFEPTDVSTGIAALSADESRRSEWYDLQGRRIAHPQRGVSVNGAGEKVIK